MTHDPSLQIQRFTKAINGGQKILTLVLNGANVAKSICHLCHTGITIFRIGKQGSVNLERILKGSLCRKEFRRLKVKARDMAKDLRHGFVGAPKSFLANLKRFPKDSESIIKLL
jgi:hypothetical protein